MGIWTDYLTRKGIPTGLKRPTNWLGFVNDPTGGTAPPTPTPTPTPGGGAGTATTSPAPTIEDLAGTGLQDLPPNQAWLAGEVDPDMLRPEWERQPWTQYGRYLQDVAGFTPNTPGYQWAKDLFYNKYLPMYGAQEVMSGLEGRAPLSFMDTFAQAAQGQPGAATGGGDFFERLGGYTPEEQSYWQLENPYVQQMMWNARIAGSGASPWMQNLQRGMFDQIQEQRDMSSMLGQYEAAKMPWVDFILRYLSRAGQ